MSIEKVNIYYDPEKEKWEGCIKTDQSKNTFFMIQKEKLMFKQMATDEIENCANQLLAHIKELLLLEKKVIWDKFQLMYEYFDTEYDIYSAEFQYENFMFYFRYRKDVSWKIANVYIESLNTSTKTFKNIELVGIEYVLKTDFTHKMMEKLKEKSKHRLRLLNWKG
jgi:hypothetical protein